MLSTAVSLSLLLLSPDPVTPDPDRALRLHVDAPIVRVVGTGSSGPRVSEFRAFDAGPPSLGFGYQVHPVVAIGARVSPWFSKLSPTMTLSHQLRRTSLVVEPYVELRSLPKARVQPFAAVGIGAEFEWLRGSVTPIEFRRVTYRPRVSGRVGVRAFVHPRVSLEADLAVLHTSTRRPPPYDVDLGSSWVAQSRALRSFSGALNVGASVWF